jgi:hypothetical protein
MKVRKQISYDPNLVVACYFCGKITSLDKAYTEEWVIEFMATPSNTAANTNTNTNTNTATDTNTAAATDTSTAAHKHKHKNVAATIKRGPVCWPCSIQHLEAVTTWIEV